MSTTIEKARIYGDKGLGVCGTHGRPSHLGLPSDTREADALADHQVEMAPSLEAAMTPHRALGYVLLYPLRLFTYPASYMGTWAVQVAYWYQEKWPDIGRTPHA